MEKKWIFLIILAIVVGGGYYLHSQGEIGKPTADVKSVKVNEITFNTTELTVQIIAHNPNPLGVTLNKVNYNVYFLQNGNPKFLGDGVRTKNIHVRADGDTTFTVPFEANNSDAIRALGEFARDEGEVRIKVNGSIFVDLKITNLEVPFSKIKPVSI